jgi:molybdopterin-guanine dinucleotide biosynthesis protein A
MNAKDITGVVLAGGRATRWDGRDKGLIQVSGRPMISHVLDALAPQV